MTSTPSSPSVSVNHGGYNVTNSSGPILPLEAGATDQPGRFNLTGTPANMTNTSLPILPVQGRDLEDHGLHDISDETASNMDDLWEETLPLPIEDRAAGNHGRYNGSFPILPAKGKGLEYHPQPHNITVRSINSASIYDTTQNFTVSSSNTSVPIIAVNVHNITARSNSSVSIYHGEHNVTASSSNSSAPIYQGENVTISVDGYNIQARSPEDTETRIVIHVPSKVSEAEEEGKWNETQGCWFEIPVNEEVEKDKLKCSWDNEN